MAVPTSGSFAMFGTGSNTTIAGAISGAGFFVSNVDNFGDLIGTADITLFDPAYAGVVEDVTTDITASLQFRNFPLYNLTLELSGSYTTDPFFYFYSSTATPGSGDTTSGAACAKTSSLSITAQILSTSGSITDIGVGGKVYGVNTSLEIITFAGQSKWYGIIKGPLGSYPDKVLQIDNGGNIIAVASCLATSRVWSSNGGSLNFPRYSLTSFGTETAAVAAGGSPFNEKTEEYNGTTWSTSNNLIRPRYALAGAGEQNAGVVFGGLGLPNGSARTEEYNGTSWAESGQLIQYRRSHAGAGTQNAALAFGGFRGDSSFPNLSCTEEYNGTSWSSGGAMTTGRFSLVGGGTQNAAVAVGGYRNDGVTNIRFCTEEYNGTSWSTESSLIVGMENSGFAGNQSAGVAFGGGGWALCINSCSEEYNGTSWSTAASLPLNLRQHSGNGTQSAAIAVGGLTCCYGSTYSNITFHYG